MIRRNFLRSAVAGVLAAIAAPTSLLARPAETDHELLTKLFANAKGDFTYITYYNKLCCVTRLLSHDVPKELKIFSDLERQRIKNRIAVLDRNPPVGVPYTIPNVKWDSVDAHIAYAKKHNDTNVLEWLKKNAYKTSCDLCGKKLQLEEAEETGSFGRTGYMCRGECEHDNVHTINYSF